MRRRHDEGRVTCRAIGFHAAFKCGPYRIHIALSVHGRTVRASAEVGVLAPAGSLIARTTRAHRSSGKPVGGRHAAVPRS